MLVLVYQGKEGLQAACASDYTIAQVSGIIQELAENCICLTSLTRAKWNFPLNFRHYA